MPTIDQTVLMIGALGAVNVVAALVALVTPWDRCTECQHCRLAAAEREAQRRLAKADDARRHHEWMHRTYGLPRGPECPGCRSEGRSS